jgi:hypothetical protein
MATRAWRRRLAPSLLAALVLSASLASAAHTHPIFLGPDGLSAESAAATGGDLDCALCAAKLRLSHGAPCAPTRPAAKTEHSARSPVLSTSSLLPASLAAPSSRAPPRLG